MSAARRERHLLIVNPAAGKGRCGKLVAKAAERLRACGLDLETRRTAGPRDATAIAREGFAEGFRSFISAGGDGTNFEVVNGILPRSREEGDPVRLGFLPFGTGVSFLRDYSDDPVEYAIASLLEKRRRPCDVLLLHHRDGRHFFINLLGFGLSVDASMRGIKYKRLGALGYVLGAVETILFARFPKLPLRIDGELRNGRVALASISNSRYTAQMLIAPRADVADGLADVVHAGPMGRLRMMHAFSKLIHGAHLGYPGVDYLQAGEVTFELDDEIDVMIDGEILRLVPEKIEVLHRALEVYA